MSGISSATPAYRGYRRQALYALHMILNTTEDADLVFQPEGQEDLAILDFTGNLLEVIQVKSYTDSLVLSDFKPDKKDSFFYRMARLLESTPELKITIVSYGEIGPQLSRALECDGTERRQIAKKLADSGFISEPTAQSLLRRIRAQLAEEETLQQEIRRQLGKSLLGVDPDAALELLHYWLYICSEGKRRITRQDVIDRMNSVGEFLSQRAAHLKEWGATILPIKDQPIDDQMRHDLADEFYQGISANYDHILANLDVVRHDRLDEIAEKFREARIVIIHGASGQGKTTLAYRFLRDSFPNQWRFRVRLIESRQHALSLVAALSGHADAMNMPIAVYLDVSASDRDWPDFARELSTHRNIRLLVTVREEDLQRASLSGAAMRFAEVELAFTETEARDIYQSLVEKRVPAEFPGFEEAWRRFGSEGPLMEFVYLVTQGDSLRARLAEQVVRLEEDVRLGRLKPEELQLLRLVAVASAYEARLKVTPLVDSLRLELPKRTLQLFEKEYLLRMSPDGSLVFGLHPIRSALLADCLSDPTLTPWSASAQACLPLICESDFEIFLLYAFSRRPDDTESLWQALALLQPSSWVAIAGITRALIWLGIREYVHVNHQLIVEAFEESRTGRILMLDYEINHRGPVRRTDEERVFGRAGDWLTRRTKTPSPPRTR